MSSEIPPPLYLRRIDPARNMRRFYTLYLQKTLFGEMTLTRHWGRIGTRGQALTQTFQAPDDAFTAFARLCRQKRSRGYGEICENCKAG